LAVAPQRRQLHHQRIVGIPIAGRQLWEQAAFESA
jgi:hypothetical protein